MKIVEYIVETLVATSVMTAFSYLVSKAFRKLFTEPVLIGYVSKLCGITVHPKVITAASWVLHYLIGFAFVAGYHWTWNTGLLTDDVPSGILLGAISGILGIFGWMMIFRLPRQSPRVAFKEYYLQLFVAHVLLGVSAVVVHWLFANQ